MRNRLKLHEELQELGIVNAKQIYFQPPESIKLKYPCIIYHLTGVNVQHADDTKYLSKNRYTLTIISTDPDNDIAEKIVEHFPYSRFDRRYRAENLYHDSVELFY